MRAKISDDIKTAMKAGDKTRLGVLRLINAAIQSAEIEARTTLDDAGVVTVMTKMVKQRRDSIQQYESGNRPDLAAIEKAEIAVIEGYLPAQMSEAEVADMGKVMGVLKGKYAGRMDFQKASAAVKAALIGV
jgi:uncharacterized protein